MSEYAMIFVWSSIVPAKEIPRMFMAMGILTSYESTAMSELCLSCIHCLRAQYQPVVICAICTYCLWFTGVLRPEYYLTIHVFNPGKSPTRIPLNATVNNHPSKICIKCNCRRYYLTIRVTVIPNFSPLSKYLLLLYSSSLLFCQLDFQMRSTLL